MVWLTKLLEFIGIKSGSKSYLTLGQENGCSTLDSLTLTRLMSARQKPKRNIRRGIFK